MKKIYSLDKINTGQLYGCVLLYMAAYLAVMLLVIAGIMLVYPEFDQVGLTFAVPAVVAGNYSYRRIYRKATTKLDIQLSKTKIKLEDRELLLSDIQRITIKGKQLNCYPTVTIQLVDDSTFSFRVYKDRGYAGFLDGLKSIPGIARVLRLGNTAKS